MTTTHEGQGGLGICSECLKAARVHKPTNTVTAYCPHRQSGGFKSKKHAKIPNVDCWIIYQPIGPADFWRMVDMGEAMGEADEEAKKGRRH
jgi:hypothetical protein